MKNGMLELREKIINMIESGLNQKQISIILNMKSSSTISYHLKKCNYEYKKIKCKCQNEWCNKEFEIVEFEYNKNPNLHKKCQDCRLYEKKCNVCGKYHNKQALTCNKNCAYELRKISWLENYGVTHIFNKKSDIRKNINKKLFENYGVVNVFQREDIKIKIKNILRKKYNVDHPSQIIENYIKRRENGEKMGILIPLNELSEYQIYRNNVLAFTEYNLRIFGNIYFGIDWKNKRGCKDSKLDFQIDHNVSVKNGYLKKIEPYIIGSIVNLRLILMFENLSKSSDSHMTIEELIYKYNIFENNEEHKKLLNEMKTNRSKYYDYFLKNNKKNEN